MAQKKLPKFLSLHTPQFNPQDIIGRGEELKELRHLLTEGGNALLVNGMGGIGKTCLAQAYLTKHSADYAHILWLSLADGDMASSLVSAPSLADNLDVDTVGKHTPNIAREMLNALSTIEDQPNLLVIDNAEKELEHWRDALPKGGHWHILVTSRQALFGFQSKTIDFLSEDAAKSLFKKHYTRNELDDLAISELVSLVDYHTLTIEVLAKTAQQRRTSLARLKTVLEKDVISGIKVHHQHQQVDKILSYLRGLFQINEEALSEQESWLLKQFVCMPSTFLHFDLLKLLLGSADDEDLAEHLSATLYSLEAQGWLLIGEGGEQYKMHAIVREALHPQLSFSIDDIRLLLNNVRQILYVDQTKDNPADKFELIPFGQAIVSRFEDNTNTDISLLQNNLAILLKELGEYERAKALLEKALASDEQNYGHAHRNTAVSYSNLATVLQDLGEYEGAKALMEKALASNENNFGEDHPNTAVSYSNLALVLKELGSYERAKALLEKALTYFEQNFGEAHPTTARNYSNLAMVLKALGDYKEAKRLLEKALASDQQNFGEAHPNTAVSYSNLASVIKILGDYEGAKVLLEKALASDKKNFGEVHPTTAASYSDLALLLQDLGDYEEAKILLEKVLICDEQSFGEDHPSTAVRYSNLALVHQDLGDYEEAKVLLEKALASNQQNFGTNHPNVAVNYSNLATVLTDLGDYKGAKVLLEKALTSNKQNFGEAHPATAVSYSNLALVLKDLGDYERAKVLLEKALVSDEQNFGETHSTTAVSYSNLALVLKELGDYEKALKLLKKTYVIMEGAYPPGHPYIEVTKNNLSSLQKYLNSKIL